MKLWRSKRTDERLLRTRRLRSRPNVDVHEFRAAGVDPAVVRFFREARSEGDRLRREGLIHK
jgi:hypothetical protein